MTSKGSDQTARMLDYSTTLRPLTEQHLAILSLKRGYTDWSVSTFVKKTHCWQSQVTPQIYYIKYLLDYLVLEKKSYFKPIKCL